MKTKEKDILETIKSLDVNKYTFEEISEMVNCNEKTVRNIFKKYNISKNICRREGRNKKLLILSMINKDFTQSQIANELNVSLKNVINFCYNHNIKNPNRTISIKMSDNTYQIFLGSMLGDGHISQGRLRLKHSIKQKEYLLFKASLLSELDFRIREFDRYDKRTNKYYSFISLDTKVYKEIKLIEKEWYGLKKTIPNSIININALGLAIWFMDDGYKSGKSVQFATQSFSFEELDMLQNVLWDRFNLYTTIRLNRTLYIRKKSYNEFYNLISEYVISSMRYKFPYTNI